jgi:ArsR family transcriptional regulator
MCIIALIRMSACLPMTPVELFKHFAEETRLKSLLLLSANKESANGELCVCELMCALELSQPKISRHLAQLRNAGLVQDRRAGKWVYYRIHPELASWIVELLQLTLQQNRAFVADAQQRLAPATESTNPINCC